VGSIDLRPDVMAFSDLFASLCDVSHRRWRSS